VEAAHAMALDEGDHVVLQPRQIINFGRHMTSTAL
jgi:hypothetical protein